MENGAFSKKIISTSKDTAELEDVVLRETNTTRLVFKTVLVNNKKDQQACVKGVFAYKRKRQNDNWEICKTLNLTDLKADEWVKIDLKSEEILKLFNHLSQCREIYKNYGIPFGEKRILLVDEVFDEFIKSIRKKLNADEIKMLVNKLNSLDSSTIGQLNYVAGIANFKKLLEVWNLNKENDNEDFWQKLFRNNYWCISNLFTEPVMFFNEKAFVGGKGIENKGGKLVDFLYKNKITSYVSLVEIKTPKTKLIGSEYRNGIYGISSELSSSINQVLSYKDKMQKDYYRLFAESETKFELINPKCILICGNITDSLKNNCQKSSFELFRKNLKDVEIITYDELFSKIEIFLKVFSGEVEIFEENNEFENGYDNF
jgi:uncharacterized lipoprotein YehR (DUF1307 family)